MGSIAELIVDIVTNAGTFGLASWLGTAVVIKFYTDIWPGKETDPSNHTKRVIQFFTPLVLVQLIYWAGFGFSLYQFTLETYGKALYISGAEALGALGIFTVTKRAEQKQAQLEAIAKASTPFNQQPPGGV